MADRRLLQFDGNPMPSAHNDTAVGYLPTRAGFAVALGFAPVNDGLL
jgi:hypothetical protein